MLEKVCHVKSCLDRCQDEAQADREGIEDEGQILDMMEEHLKKVRDNCTAFMKAVAEIIKGDAQQRLKTKADEGKAIFGAPWKKSLKADATWKQVAALANQTLLQGTMVQKTSTWLKGAQQACCHSSKDGPSLELPFFISEKVQKVLFQENADCLRLMLWMREFAAWVLNATHWFSLWKQPMMIVIWCRDWSDASKFQYLMQILQVQVQDYVPKYHIFVDQEDNVDKLKDFNPMWSFPTASVNQCWEQMTFGMAPWHLSPDVEKSKSKEASQSQSPIAAFKACNVIQAIGIAHSKIVLPVVTPKVNPRIGPTAPLHGAIRIHGNFQQSMQINCVEFHVQVLFYARNVLYWCESGSAAAQQEECKSSELGICRLSKHRHVWCNDQLDSMHCPYC